MIIVCAMRYKFSIPKPFGCDETRYKLDNQSNQQFCWKSIFALIMSENEISVQLNYVFSLLILIRLYSMYPFYFLPTVNAYIYAI